MTKTSITSKEGFYLLLDTCKHLDVNVKFGLPKFIPQEHRAALHYNGKKKKSTIYLPKAAQNVYSSTYNAMLAHEIGHYIVARNGCSFLPHDGEFEYILEFFEEGMAWIMAVYLLQHLNMSVDKPLKKVLKNSLNSYLRNLYTHLDDHLLSFLSPLYKLVIIRNKHVTKQKLQSKTKKKTLYTRI